jgi:hypothetical protein
VHEYFDRLPYDGHVAWIIISVNKYIWHDWFSESYSGLVGIY